MASKTDILRLATRGSALALAQSNLVAAQCRAAFPNLQVELNIIKTTGDKLQTASLASANLPKGLFTKELETALLSGEADLAVHSLKDLPTELPAGLILGGVSKRADVRDALIYRDAEWLSRNAAAGPGRRGFGTALRISDLPNGATVATSSTRRSAELLDMRPDLKIVPIRGNVGTRLKKLAEQPELDAIILAAAGLERLCFQFLPDGKLISSHASGDPQITVPPGLLATRLEPSEMLPCVGQAALGFEIREGDSRMQEICNALTDPDTFQCVLAERAFLRGLGGGCQVPVGAYAVAKNGIIKMEVVSFLQGKARRAVAEARLSSAEELGRELAIRLV
ncbi:MAG TPA: hydroxymethylbilane synthase [Verrucomicrobiae bacterium]